MWSLLVSVTRLPVIFSNGFYSRFRLLCGHSFLLSFYTMKSSRRRFIKYTSMAAAGIICGGKVFADSGSEYTYHSLSEISSLLQQRKVSSLSITKACLARIKILNPRVNAFITVTDRRAIDDARKADREIRHGKWKGPLHGVPI